MQEAALKSQNIISLNMKNTSSTNRELAVSFARQFDEIDEETSRKILQLLMNRKKGEKLMVEYIVEPKSRRSFI